jgi:PEP-CTERM putative exosortase interaction domain
MRVLPVRALSALVVLLIASSASAVTIDWTPIGNPGNPADTQVMTTDRTSGYGSVPYTYSIGTYEVTNAQYTEFLNAKAKSDPLGLYDSAMAFVPDGGIVRTGSAGTYSYAVIAGRENKPVVRVSFYDAIRFANWMNNGQGNGDTETGAYTLLGPYTTSPYGNAIPSNGTTVTRNTGASIFLPTENEWYKAAYFNPITASYFDYPTSSDTQPVCATPTASANRANCGLATLPAADLTNVGSYPGSRSPYGTYDQAGNAYELNETIINGGRGYRGGSFGRNPQDIAASWRYYGADPDVETDDLGFRIATTFVIPEPGTGLLVAGGLIGLAVRRRSAKHGDSECED